MGLYIHAFTTIPDPTSRLGMKLGNTQSHKAWGQASPPWALLKENTGKLLVKCGVLLPCMSRPCFTTRDLWTSIYVDHDTYEGQACLSVYLTLVCIMESLRLGMHSPVLEHEPRSIRFEPQHWGEKKKLRPTQCRLKVMWVVIVCVSQSLKCNCLCPSVLCHRLLCALPFFPLCSCFLQAWSPPSSTFPLPPCCFPLMALKDAETPSYPQNVLYSFLPN